MAQVPYQPFSTERPDMAGTPEVRLNVPPQAFGTGVAQAVQGLGGSLEHVADQYVNTSMEFKRLDLEANVNKAETGYLQETGDLDNQFRLMQGKTAQDNLTRHTQALTDTRESYRASLGTDYERKLFDSRTMRRLSYDVVNAGNYAATQFKQYSKQANTDAQISMADRASKDPYNLKGLDDTVNATESLEKQQAQNEQDSAEGTSTRVKQSVGRIIKGATDTLSKKDPNAALALLNRYNDQGRILNVDYLAAQQKIKENAIRYYGATDARALTSGTLIPANHVVSQNLPAIQKAAEKYGDATTFTPENIYKLVQQESQGRNLPPNEHGYAGYFQMKPSEFGLTPADFRKMSFEQQLDLYANSYLKKYGYTGTQDLGVMNAAPAFANAPDTTIAYRAGSVEAAANPAWVRASAAGGAVTVGGIKAWMEAGGAGLQKTPELNLPDIAANAAERAKNYPVFKDDPDAQARYADQVMANANRSANLLRSQQNQQKIAARNAINTVLMPGQGEDRGPMSWEQAEAKSPGFADAVDRARQNGDPLIVKHVMDSFNQNARIDVPLTPERHDRFNEVMKWSYGIEPGDKEKFQNVSVPSLDLPRKESDIITRKQLQMQQQTEDTRKYRSAMSNPTITAMLAENKIFNEPKNTKRKAQYDAVMGAYFDGIKQFVDKNKYFPDDDEQVKIFTPLLNKTVAPWYSFTPSRFQFEIPPAEKEKNRQDFIRNVGRPPTPQEEFRDYQKRRAGARPSAQATTAGE